MREVAFVAAEARLANGSEASRLSTSDANSETVRSSPLAIRQSTLIVGCLVPASRAVMYGRSISIRPARSSWVSFISSRRDLITAENARIKRSFRLGRIPTEYVHDVT